MVRRLLLLAISVSSCGGRILSESEPPAARAATDAEADAGASPTSPAPSLAAGATCDLGAEPSLVAIDTVDAKRCRSRPCAAEGWLAAATERCTPGEYRVRLSGQGCPLAVHAASPSPRGGACIAEALSEARLCEADGCVALEMRGDPLR